MKNKLINILCLSIIIGCNTIIKNNDFSSSKISNSFGRKIIFPDSLIFQTEDKHYLISNSNLKSSETKIISILNGNCYSCVEELNSWINIHTMMLENYGTDKIFFVVTNVNQSYFQKMYSMFIPYNFQIIIDEKGSIVSINKLFENKIPNTFLLDEENKIRLIGNPINNEELLTLYLDNI